LNTDAKECFSVSSPLLLEKTQGVGKNPSRENQFRAEGPEDSTLFCNPWNETDTQESVQGSHGWGADRMLADPLSDLAYLAFLSNNALMRN
jgi:hypothetical protein